MMAAIEIKVLAGLALLLGLFLGYQSWHHHVYAQGEANVQVQWDKAKMQRQQADSDAATKNAEANRLIAKAQSATNQRVSQQYETAIAKAAEQNTILRAAVAHSGGLFLPADSDPAAMPSLAAGAGQPNAASGLKLPGQLTELLLSEAERADKIAAQLSAIQGWIRENKLAQ